MRPLAAALLAVVGLSAPAASSPPRQPALLRGVPLGGDTGLRLVVADNPPFVLSVDTGRVAPVHGIPALERGTLSVLGVGGQAAVVDARAVYLRGDLYAVHGGGVSSLGTGSAVAPAADGRAVWVKSSVDRSHCALRQVALDGRRIRAPRPFPCATTLYPGGSLGLVVNRTRVVDPLTGRTILRTRWGVLAAAGKTLVLAGPGEQFTLLDVQTRSERRLRWPSILDWTDAPAVDPRGRLVALAFADPAWKGTQALDVWLLDTETGRMTQLPGMPALVSLKRTSMAWTDDGRLVLLAQNEGKDMVAVWRPGERRLALKTVQLPERGDSGSDSFAPVG